MRIVTWNCNLALSRKLPQLLALKPDIAIVQECEEAVIGLPGHAQFIWTGNNPRKGLGVISFGAPMVLEPRHRATWSYFLPIQFPTLNIKLLAIWAYNHRAAKFGPEYVGMALPILDALTDWMSDGRTVAAGDLNNSVVWDKPKGPNNFATIDAAFLRMGLVSSYHGLTEEALGAESSGTYFHTKDAAKRFHIDYLYASTQLCVRRLRVEPFEQWRVHSDHVPLVVDIDEDSYQLRSAR